jgi:hypothetical protein
MTIAPLLPLVKILEQLFVENYALRATLGPLAGWDDSTVDGHKKTARKVFGSQFAAVYRHADNPAKLQAALESILRAKKPN